MKVAVIIDFWFPAIGGGQINAWEISKRLASKNLKIDIITRNCGQDNLEKVPNLTIYKFGPKTRPDNLITELYFLLRLFFFILRRDYSLIHVHPFLPALPAKILSIIKGVPLILTVHGTRLFENEKLTPSRLLEKFILTGIKYDVQTSVTKAFLKIPNVNKKIEVIPNGVDINKYNKTIAKKFTKPTILYVGRFDAVKRVDDLIMSAKNLSKKIKNIQLILVGYGYQEEKLKNLVKNLNLTNVKFTGFKSGEELIKLYKRSHVFVLPSQSEGQPLTIFEAHAASLPVVATNVGGIPEIVKSGYDGILVPPNNPQKLSEAIFLVLKTKNDFGKNGLKTVKKSYGWDKIALLTHNVYGEVLNK